MRFKVSMINDLGNHHAETIIANNKNAAKMKVKTFNPNSMFIDAERFYK